MRQSTKYDIVLKIVLDIVQPSRTTHVLFYYFSTILIFLTNKRTFEKIMNLIDPPLEPTSSTPPTLLLLVVVVVIVVIFDVIVVVVYIFHVEIGPPSSSSIVHDWRGDIVARDEVDPWERRKR